MLTNVVQGLPRGLVQLPLMTEEARINAVSKIRNDWNKPGVPKWRPEGRIRPAEASNSARGDFLRSRKIYVHIKSKLRII